MADKVIDWREEAIEEETRIFCCGLPLPKVGEPALHSIARGKCAGPHCPCWEDGKRVTKAALDAAVRIEINQCPVPLPDRDGTASNCIAKGNCGCDMGDRLVAAGILDERHTPNPLLTNDEHQKPNAEMVRP